MQRVQVTDVGHGVPVMDWRCICSPAQVGSASRDAVAPFNYSHQVEDEGIGSPLVFSSEKSGAQLWWHYPFDLNNNPPYIEVKHTDGTIARYELASGPGGPFFRDSETTATADYWQLKWTRDAYDNKTEYFYASGRLDHIAYPNGLVETWNWTPSWVTANFGAGHSGLEVTYSSVATGALPDLAWYMAFENIGTAAHFRGKVRYYFAQASKYVADAQTGSLYDVSAPTNAHLVTEFCYGTGANANDVTLIQKFRHPVGGAPAPAPSGADVRAVLETTYVALGLHEGKVASQTLLQFGGVMTTYEYDPSSFAPTYPYSLPQGGPLHTFKMTSSDGRSQVWDVLLPELIAVPEQ
jgi:hypothetical protein